MPVNFEIDFVQPLLLDFEAGNITDATSYSEALSKYYEAAVSKGMPVGVPPTLPAPSLSGAPSPVGTGPDDAYKQPLDRASVTKMENVLAAYFQAKEIFIAEGALEGVKYSLEYAINKAKWTRDTIKGIVAQTKIIIKEIEEFPDHVKALIEVAKEKVVSYGEMVKVLKEELEELQFTGLEKRIAELELIENTERDGVVGERTEDQNKELEQLKTQNESQKEFIATTFAKELEILDAVKNLDVSNVAEATRSINTISQYVKSITKTIKEDKQKAYFQKRLSGLLTDVIDLGAVIAEPLSFGRILSDFKSDKAGVMQKVEKGKKALKKIQYIVDFLEPQLRKLKKKIKEETDQIEAWLKIKETNLKEKIAEKAANIAKKKKVAAVKERFEKAKEDIETFKKKYDEKVKVSMSLASASAKLVDKANGLLVAVTTLKGDLEKEVPTIKEELLELKNNVEASIKKIADAAGAVEDNFDNLIQDRLKDVGKDRKTTDAFDGFLKKQGFGDLGKIIKPAFEGLALDFQLIRTELETPKERYSKYTRTIEGIISSYEDMEQESKALAKAFAEFEEVKVVKTSQSDRAKRRAKKKGERVPLQDRDTIIKILKKLTILKEKIQAFLRKQEKKLKAFIDKKVAQLKVVAEQITIAAINAIPIKTQVSDTATKKEKAEEKKNQIKKTKVKLETVAKQVAALAEVGAGASTLASNISGGKYFTDDNSKPMTQIATGMFNYQVVGINSDSAAYTKAAADRSKIIAHIKLLEQIETYVKIAIIAIKETTSEEAREALAEKIQNKKDGLGQGFIADIKKVLDSLKNEQEGGRGSSKAFVDESKEMVIKMLTDFIETPPTDPTKLFDTLRLIGEKLKGKSLTRMLSSLDIVNVLVQIENKYLSKTHTTVKVILGQLDEAAPKSLEVNTNPEATAIENTAKLQVQKLKAKKEEAKQRLREISIGGLNLYDGLMKLNDCLDGSGSFVLALIEMIIKLVNDLKAWVKKKIDGWIKRQKEKLKERKARIIEENDAEIQKIKKSVVNVDAVIQQATFGIAAMLYWTGASWTNSVGTQFTMVTIGPYPKLLKVGAKDGLEAVIREIAGHFQKQLDSSFGIVLPPAAYGIPPFTFSGYK